MNTKSLAPGESHSQTTTFLTSFLPTLIWLCHHLQQVWPWYFQPRWVPCPTHTSSLFTNKLEFLILKWSVPFPVSFRFDHLLWCISGQLFFDDKHRNAEVEKLGMFTSIPLVQNFPSWSWILRVFRGYFPSHPLRPHIWGVWKGFGGMEVPPVEELIMGYFHYSRVVGTAVQASVWWKANIHPLTSLDSFFPCEICTRCALHLSLILMH